MDKVPEEDIERFRERVVGRSISEGTFGEYERWIQRFEAWCDEEEPGLATLEDWDTLLASSERVDYPWRVQSQTTPPDSYAYRTRIISISAIKSWLRRQYNIDVPEQPADIAIGEQAEFNPTYLSRERVNEVIESAGEACNCRGCEAALAVSYDAILRASELVMLRRDDIDLSDGTLSVTATKGSRDSDIVLGEDTVELVDRWLSDRGDAKPHLFTNTYGNPWKASSWAAHVQKKHVDAGSHSWGRHTPIFHMFDAGADFGDVYRRARHVDASTTAQYARIVGVETPDWAGRD
jgi:integrase